MKKKWLIGSIVSVAAISGVLYMIADSCALDMCVTVTQEGETVCRVNNESTDSCFQLSELSPSDREKIEDFFSKGKEDGSNEIKTWSEVIGIFGSLDRIFDTYGQVRKE